MTVKVYFTDESNNVFSVSNIYSHIPAEKDCIDYFNKYLATSGCKYLKAQFFDYRNDTWIDLI